MNTFTHTNHRYYYYRCRNKKKTSHGFS